jgi:polyphosphate kinase 2
MGKSHHKDKHREHAADRARAVGAPQPVSHQEYEAQLHLLQIELVKLQRHVIRQGARILVLLEGRDAAGKDGCIKRITEFLSPREIRVVALPKPSSRDQTAWYFQRYVRHLPVAEELVLFNRSWYNRAGVEHVMGFCTAEEYDEFIASVPKFEEMLVHSGLVLLKYYLDIDREEQAHRLENRRHDPLKQWKSSPIDAVAVEHWTAYSAARDLMFLRTSTPVAPWQIVRADDKRLARLNLIRDILSNIEYAGQQHDLVIPDPAVVFPFAPTEEVMARLAP